MEYNYFSSYGDYGSPTTLIPKKTVDDLTANAPKELDTFKEVADKINSIEDGGSGSSEQIEALSQTVEQNKADADAKFEEIDSALETKADASALEDLATKDELEQVKTDVQTIIQDAPESLDTLKEIADLLATKQDAAEVVDALASKVDTEDFDAHVSANDEAFAAINETLAEKADKNEIPDTSGFITESALEGYVQDADYVHTDNNYTDEDKAKLGELTNYDDTALAERVTALEGANYVEDADYVHTDNNFADEDKAKLDELTNYDDTALTERVATVEETLEGLDIPSLDGYVQDANYVHTDNNYTDEDKAKLDELENYDDTALAERVTTLENAGYLTTLEADTRYYEKENANSIFIAKSQYEDDMDLKADKSQLGDYATDTELAVAVHDLVVRLNKLEAQNAVLVEKGTESADDINAMTPEEAASADIVVATDEAIEALSTPKTFNSISVAGGEVGGNTVINLLATDSIDVNGLTVSGTKGTGNGKIIFGSNDVTISNLNIEQGCTVYNVFEGKQDKAAENCIDNFTATNIIVDDTDLAHNVFNIYQVNDGANILIKDSVFNLNVANSNVLRMSNITNAKNVTITFENVDWNYENKPYSESDAEYAGLMIYQPYGYDSAFTGDTSNIQTWTINVKNCRYNGEYVMGNNFGTIKQPSD